MQRLAFLIGGALASHVLCFGVVAQEPGPGMTTPPAYRKISPEAKAAGKAHRRQEGLAATQAGAMTGEREPMPAVQSKVPREQRQQARAQHKAETLRAARAGEIRASGEVGAAK